MKRFELTCPDARTTNANWNAIGRLKVTV
jgi:hypothetical protein